jgi:hypothetical protein
MALSLDDGIVASIGGRHDNNVIALYEFKAGSGATAFDTSGVEPALNLQYTGSFSEEDRWVGAGASTSAPTTAGKAARKQPQTA